MLGYLRGFDNDIFDQFESMQRQMDQLFGDWRDSSGIRSATAGSFPAINVGASPEQVDVYVFAPGVNPDDLSISLLQNQLTVSGSRKVDMPERAYRSERYSGDFHRVVTLPEDVDSDKVNAIYRDGVLHITLSRRGAVQPLKIEIH